MNKKSLLILSDYFPPAYHAGGPVRSVYNLVTLLKDHFDISILTSNSDLSVVEPLDVEKDKWIESNGFKVQYLSGENQTRQTYLNEFKSNFDFIYLNSMYSSRFTLLPLWIIRSSNLTSKIILAPRGMLEAGSVKKKFLKKRIFLLLSRLLGLYKNVDWHVTSPSEGNNVHKYFGNKTSIHEIKNIPSMFGEKHNRVKDAGNIKMLFYSRIGREKNLIGGLDILKKIIPSGPVKLDIYGPIQEEKYWNSCQKLITDLNKSEKFEISYKGFVQPDQLFNLLESYQVLFSPSSGENFGHGIVECMSSGLPALLSDRTPWRNLSDSQAGFDIPLQNIEEWQNSINFFIDMDQEKYKEHIQGAFQYIHSKMSLDDLRNRYIQMFS